MAFDKNSLFGGLAGNAGLGASSYPRQLYAVREQDDGSGRALYIACQRMFSFTSSNLYQCGNCGYEIELNFDLIAGPALKECPTCYCWLEYK